jgi:SAM-dependent methyltransferase
MLVVSGSTNRPEQTAPTSRDPGSEPGDRVSALAGLGGPIDLRARAAAAGQAGASIEGSSRTASVSGPFPAGSSWSRLIDSLVGDVLLDHVPGCRVLDLGHGSPEIAEWIRDRIGDSLSVVEKSALESPSAPIADSSGFLPASEFLDAEGNFVMPEEGDENLRLPEYRDASFDVVYCLRTFPHLGYDTESSERLGRQLLREAARVTADGGTVFVQIANSRSLRGFIEGIRNPITVVSRRRMILGDRYGLTRWDTLSRFMSFLPPELEVVRVHGLGVVIPHNATLQIPIVGRVLSRFEWRLRDMGVARRFGAQLLVVMRRLHRSDPTLVAGAPQRTSLSSSLLEALSSGTRTLGIGRAASSGEQAIKQSEVEQSPDDTQK